MCKKYIKVFVLSCIFVLLLGLSCQSLAVTSDEVASYIYNYFTKQGTVNVSSVTNWLLDNEIFIENFTNSANSADRWCLKGNPGYSSSQVTKLDLCYQSDLTNTEMPFQLSNNSYFTYMGNNNYSSGVLYRLTLSNGSISTSTSTTYFVSGQGVNYYFGNSNVMNGNTIVKASGCYPAGYDTGFEYNHTIWEFSPNDSNVIHVEGSPHEFHKIYKTSLNPPLGIISDSVWCDLISISYYYYDKSSNLWKIAYTKRPYNRDNDLSISDIFVTTVVDNVQSSIITVPNSLLVNDMIVEADFVSNNGDLELIQTWSYVTSGFTVFSGDTVDTDNTFSGDYYIDYLNNINDIIDNPTNQINNNLIDIQSTIIDNSLVGSIFDEYFSGDSGDIANRLGYHVFDNPFLDLFDTIAVGVRNVLLGSGNQTLSFNLHGHTWSFNSDSFIIPNTGIRIFVALVVNFFIVFFVCGFFFNMIMHIAIGELSPVLRFFKSHAMSITKFM